MVPSTCTPAVKRGMTPLASLPYSARRPTTRTRRRAAPRMELRHGRGPAAPPCPPEIKASVVNVGRLLAASSLSLSLSLALALALALFLRPICRNLGKRWAGARPPGVEPGCRISPAHHGNRAVRAAGGGPPAESRPQYGGKEALSPA